MLVDYGNHCAFLETRDSVQLLSSQHSMQHNDTHVSLDTCKCRVTLELSHPAEHSQRVQSNLQGWQGPQALARQNRDNLLVATFLLNSKPALHSLAIYLTSGVTAVLGSAGRVAATLTILLICPSRACFITVTLANTGSESYHNGGIHCMCIARLA